MTIFIIIAVVLVIAVGFVIYITQRDADTDQEDLSISSAYQGQQELDNYVSECLKPIVLEGIEIERLQAGWIYTVPTWKANEDYLEVYDPKGRTVVVNGDRVRVEVRGQPNTVPFWIKEEDLNVPSLEFLESQLEKYIETELPYCIQDFAPFVESGRYEIDFLEPEVDVEMESSIVVNVDYPLDVKAGGVEYTMNEFSHIVPINMKKVHGLSTDLAAFEIADTYLEGHTMQLISLYGWSGGDPRPDDLPPMSWSEGGFSCDYEQWTMFETEERLKKIVAKNMEYLNFNGTDFDRVIRDDEIEQGVYNSFIKYYLNGEPDIKVDMMYRTYWFFDMDVSPKAGGVIKPDRASSQTIPFIPVFCNFKYFFKYDVQYPVLTTVTDYNSASIDPIGNVYTERDNFTFQFPMRVVIYGNQEREQTGFPAYMNTTEYMDYQDIASGELSYETITFDENGNEIITTVTIPQSSFCDSAHKTENNVSIVVVDEESEDAIERVDVYYYCGQDVNDCYITRTNDSGQANTDFPPCVNGNIYFGKKDYKQNMDLFTSAGAENQRFEFELESVKNLSVDILLMDVKDFLWNYYETDGFRDTRGMILAGYRHNVDMSAIEDVSDSFGVNGSTLNESYLRIHYPIDQDPCEFIEDEAESTLVDPSTFGEPELYTIELTNGGSYTICNWSSYKYTEDAIGEKYLALVGNSVEFKEFYDIGIGSFLTGKSLPTGKETMIIAIEGNNYGLPIFYPDVSDTQIASGDYSLTTTITGKVDLSPSNMEGISVGADLELWPLGNMLGFPWSISKDELWGTSRVGEKAEKRVLFTLPVNWDVEELTPAEWLHVDDAVIDANDNSFNAELLLEYSDISISYPESESLLGGAPIVTCGGKLRIIDIDGVNNDYDPFTNQVNKPFDPISKCREVAYITLTQEQYYEFVGPEII